jgi:hypothetical protein
MASITKYKGLSSFLELKCLVGAELDATILAPGLRCLARLVIDDAHHPVLEDHATLHGVRLAAVHAKTTPHAFFLVDGRPLLYARAFSICHEIEWHGLCNKPGGFHAKQWKKK